MKINRTSFLFILLIVSQVSLISQATSWEKDSIMVMEKFQKMLEFQSSKKTDSLQFYSESIFSTTNRLLEEQYDSTLYIKNLVAEYHIGWAYYLNSEYDKVMEYYNRAEDKLKDKFGRIHPEWPALYIGKAAYYNTKGDIENSIYYFEKSLEVEFALNDSATRQMGNLYWNIGLGYERLENFNKARENYLKSAKYFQIAGAKFSSPKCYDRVGSIYIKEKKLVDAKHYYDTVYQIRKERYDQDHVQIKSALYRQADVLIRENKIEDANSLMSTIGPILTLRDAGNYFPNIADNYTQLGDSYEIIGDYINASKYYQAYLDIVFDYFGDFHSRTSIGFSKLGDFALKIGKYEEAINYYQKSIYALDNTIDTMIYTNIPDENLDYLGYILPRNVYKLGNAFLQKYIKDTNDAEDLNKAKFNIYTAIKLTDRIRNNFVNATSKQILVDNNFPIYEAAIEVNYQFYLKENDPKYLEEIFTISEKSKSILLLEHYSSSKISNKYNIPASVLDTLKTLKIEVGFQMQEFSFIKNNSKTSQSTIDNQRSLMVDAKEDLNKYLTSLQNEYPDYFTANYAEEITSIEDLRDFISKNNSTVLEYFVGESNSYLIFITPEILEVIKFDINENIQKSLSDFIQSLKLKTILSSSEYFELASTVQETFIPDRVLSISKEMIIIPDGKLSLIPFGALVSSSVTSSKSNFRALPFLIKSHSFSYDFSASVLMANLRKGVGKRFVGFAPDYGHSKNLLAGMDEDLTRSYLDIENITPLIYNVEETSEIAKLFNGVEYINEMATETNFKRHVGEYDILHLAMHAFTNDEEPLNSMFIFNEEKGEEDGLLHAYEIQNMDIDADLAVLSACETGNGKFVRGEGVSSLSRAIRNAGCASVVMSLWNAHDLSTNQIMKNFYVNLKETKNKTESIRKAKLDFLSTVEDQKYTHPFYWSTFIPTGVSEPDQSNMLIYLISGLIVLFLGIWVGIRIFTR